MEIHHAHTRTRASSSYSRFDPDLRFSLAPSYLRFGYREHLSPLASSRVRPKSEVRELVKNTLAKRETATASSGAIAREAADVKGDIRSWRRLRVRLCSGDRAAARSTIIVFNLPLYRQFTANLHLHSSCSRARRAFSLPLRRSSRQRFSAREFAGYIRFAGAVSSNFNLSMCAQARALLVTATRLSGEGFSISDVYLGREDKFNELSDPVESSKITRRIFQSISEYRRLPARAFAISYRLRHLMQPRPPDTLPVANIG